VQCHKGLRREEPRKRYGVTADGSFYRMNCTLRGGERLVVGQRGCTAGANTERQGPTQSGEKEIGRSNALAYELAGLLDPL
jgi:hypothetical protein